MGDDGARALRAAAAGDTAELRRLLRSGVSVQHADSQGRTAVFFAASGGHTETVRALVNEFHVDVRAVDNNGATPLWAASVAAQDLQRHSAVPLLQWLEAAQDAAPTHAVSNADARQNFECPVCFESAVPPLVLVPCRHTVCEGCWDKCNDVCPNCRQPAWLASSPDLIPDMYLIFP